MQLKKAQISGHFKTSRPQRVKVVHVTCLNSTDTCLSLSYIRDTFIFFDPAFNLEIEFYF